MLFEVRGQIGYHLKAKHWFAVLSSRLAHARSTVCRCCCCCWCPILSILFTLAKRLLMLRLLPMNIAYTRVCVYGCTLTACSIYRLKSTQLILFWLRLCIAACDVKAELYGLRWLGIVYHVAGLQLTCDTKVDGQHKTMAAICVLRDSFCFLNILTSLQVLVDDFSEFHGKQ